MRKLQGSSAPTTAVPLLKTCRICANAKIRCHRTQDSESCDRCLRLSKTCVFAPARRHNAASSRTRINRIGASVSVTGHNVPPCVSEEALEAPPSTRHENETPNEVNNSGTRHAPVQLATSPNSFDPLPYNMIDEAEAERLLDLFRSQMTPQFPFVMLPDSVTIQHLRHERPCLYLAILSVATFENFVLQRKLGNLFNQYIVAKMVIGKILSLDVLQGLLLQLAWAHYQPRPRSFSQYLHLATSIVADMRLDRPRKLQLWKVDFKDDDLISSWSSDELRALIGTYYLASSSSIVLQKLCCFPYTNFIFNSCEKLELHGEFPSDKYLKYIVTILHLSEAVDECVPHEKVEPPADEINTRITSIRGQLDSLKSNLPFALSECPPLLLHLNMLQLFVNQQSFPSFSAPLEMPPQTTGYNSQALSSFSESVFASKAILDIFLAMPPGHEKFISNIGWIILSCSLSFSARFDALASGPQLSHLTAGLRRCHDVSYTLRQVILRLKLIISPREDSNGDRDVFYHFLLRAKAIQAWHVRQTEHLTTSAAADSESITTDSASTVRETIPPTQGSEFIQDETGETSDLDLLNLFAENMQGSDLGLFSSWINIDQF